MGYTVCLEKLAILFEIHSSWKDTYDIYSSASHHGRALEPFVEISYVAIWYWMHEFNPKDVFLNKKKTWITAYVSYTKQWFSSSILMHSFGLHSRQNSCSLWFKAQEYTSC